ncbi:hypothetical protein LTR10_024201 [Elasticomyces elasticus]|uniref:Endosomal/vacuolar adapter protein YPT35 n=1 Tax=Exophiala sideris TaxID=1016849 RepID=A0ABR0JAP3_9EURO|nr:hypothetical protein LTR10_024201 [Elasticomyces elasticus]KAK5027951.1 hypothetical protein LTS07_006827 [Exophiala sideris]KAK5037458.1 hypothetical protein LTR13_004615 [Exophiala sideris]KAK5059119.1 hypothetical protein LTR69_006408 [Exophiala sideris]KAK5182953.1 hypothetical protein LTR44_004663 [Eurotiomycetes sp. CCFEE 6388]
MESPTTTTSDPQGPDSQESNPNGLVTPRPTHTPPPYWQHNRGASYSSNISLDHRPAILLEDNTLTHSPTRSALWAKSIAIDDYVIVNGSTQGIGSYVVWNCKVQTLDGGPMIIRKRYSEFDELRSKLIKAFPEATKSSLPPLPPKSAVYKFRPKFLEKRREGLAYFLNCVMLNPEYAGSTIVKDFIFPPES